MKRLVISGTVLAAAAGMAIAAAPVRLGSGQSWTAKRGQTVDFGGATAITLAGHVRNARIGPGTIANAYRAVSARDDEAVIDSLVIDGLTGRQIQRDCIRLRGTVTNVRISNVHCTMRDTPQVSPHLPQGLQLISGDGVTIRDSSFRGFRMVADKKRYWNGDGVTTEDAVRNVTIVNVTANDNSDAGFDIKSQRTRMDRVSASGNARNFRFWRPITVGTMTVGDSMWRGGISGTAGVWIKGSPAMPVIAIDRLVVRMKKRGTIIHVDEGPAEVRIGSCDIQAPADARFILSASKATRTKLGPGCPR